MKTESELLAAQNRLVEAAQPGSNGWNRSKKEVPNSAPSEEKPGTGAAV